MEAENSSTMLESTGEDQNFVLIETPKSEGEHNEEELFLVSHVQEEQYSEQRVEEATSAKPIEGTLVWTSLCRICSNASDRLIPIFEGEGVEYDLDSKILKHLPIQVSKDDTLPLQCCYHCAATLLAWHELSEGCLNAEKKLLEIQSALQDKHQYYIATPLDNLEVPTTVTATKITSCIEVVQPDQKVNEKNETHNAEEINKSNRCSPCAPSVGSAINARDKSDDRYSGKDFIKGGIARLMLPNEKHASSVSIGNGQSELQKDLATTTRLDKDKKTPGLRKRKSATKDFQGKVKRNKRNYITKQDVERAGSKVMDDNGRIYYKCKECEKFLSTAYNLIIHRNIHTGERPYVCLTCNKSFGSASCLNRHVRDVHNGVKKFPCDMCDRFFASRTSRDEHRHTHTNERPHMCEICGKSFKQRASLHAHRLYHSQYAPYRCSQCDRGFRRKQDLEKHNSIHSNPKVIACIVCGVRFRNKSGKNNHRCVNSDRRTYDCDFCSSKFTRKYNLKKHFYRVHEVETQVS